MNRSLFMLTAMLGGMWITSETHAQFIPGSRSVGRSTENYLYNRPSVSPYISLTTRDASIGLPNYYTRVRPQLQARQQQQTQQRQTQQMQRELANIQSQIRNTQQRQNSQIITGRMGWSARGMPRFGSTLNYYPGMRMIQRNR